MRLPVTKSKCSQRAERQDLGFRGSILERKRYFNLQAIPRRPRSRQAFLSGAAWFVEAMNIPCWFSIECTAKQTLEFNVEIRKRFKEFCHAEMGNYHVACAWSIIWWTPNRRYLGSDGASKHDARRLWPRREKFFCQHSDFRSWCVIVNRQA